MATESTLERLIIEVVANDAELETALNNAVKSAKDFVKRIESTISDGFGKAFTSAAAAINTGVRGTAQSMEAVNKASERFANQLRAAFDEAVERGDRSSVAFEKFRAETLSTSDALTEMARSAGGDTRVFDELRSAIEGTTYAQRESVKVTVESAAETKAVNDQIKLLSDVVRTARNEWAGQITSTGEFTQATVAARKELIELTETYDLTAEQARKATQAIAFAQRGLDSAGGVASRGGLAWTAQIALANQFGQSVRNLSPELTKLSGGLGIATGALKGLTEGVDASLVGFIKLGRNITTIVPMLGALATVAAGAALAKLGMDALKTADDIVAASHRMSVGVEAVQELQHVARVTGVSVGTLEGAMDRLERRASRASLDDVFKRLGVAVRDSSGELRLAEDLFTEVSDALGGIENTTERAALAFQIFSRDASALAPVFELGAEGVAELRREARELGLVISGDTIMTLNDFSSEVDTMREQFSVARTEIGAAFLPVMRVAMNFLQDVAVPYLQNIAARVGEFAQKFVDASEEGDEFRKDLARTMRPLIILGEIAGAIGNVVTVAFTTIWQSAAFMANKVAADILKIRKAYEDFMGWLTGNHEFRSEAVEIWEGGELVRIDLFTPTEYAIMQHETAMRNASDGIVTNITEFVEKTMARIDRVMDPAAYDDIFEPFVQSLGDAGKRAGGALTESLTEEVTGGLVQARQALAGSLAHAREELNKARTEFEHAVSDEAREAAHLMVVHWTDAITEIEAAFKEMDTLIEDWSSALVGAGQEFVRNAERAAWLKDETADTEAIMRSLLGSYLQQIALLEEGSAEWATLVDEAMRLQQVIDDMQPEIVAKIVPQALIDATMAGTAAAAVRDAGGSARGFDELSKLTGELRLMIRHGEDAEKIFAKLQEVLAIKPMTFDQIREFTMGWADANRELFFTNDALGELAGTTGNALTSVAALSRELRGMAEVAAALGQPFDHVAAEISQLEREIKAITGATGKLSQSDQEHLAGLQARLAALRELEAAENMRVETMERTAAQMDAFGATFAEINAIGREQLDVFEQLEVQLGIMAASGEITTEQWKELLDEVAKARQRVADVDALNAGTKRLEETTAKVRDNYAAALGGIAGALGEVIDETEEWADAATAAWRAGEISASEYIGVLERIQQVQSEQNTEKRQAQMGAELGKVANYFGIATDAVQGLSEAFKDGVVDGNSLMDTFISVGASIGDMLLPGLGQAIGAIGGFFKSIIGDMSNGLAEVNKSIAGAVAGANLLGQSLVESLGQAHTSQVSRGGLLGLFGLTKAQLNNEGFQAALNIAEGLASGLAGAMKAQDFSKAFDDMVTNLMVDSMIQTALMAPAVQDAILAATQAIEDGNISGAASIIEGVKQELSGTAHAISELLHTDVIEPVVEAFSNEFTSSLESAFKSAFNAIDVTSGLIQLGDSVTDILRNAIIQAFLEATAMQSLTQKLGEEIEWVVQQALSGGSMRDLFMTMRKEQVQLSREVSAARERYEESPTAANREAVADLEAQLERMTARIMPMFEKLRIDPNAVMDVDMSGLENVTEEWKAQWEMLSDILADLGLGFEALNDSVVDMTASMQNVPPIFKDITRSFDSVVGDYGFTGTAATMVGDTNVTIVVNAPIYGVEDLEGTIRDTYIDIERERGLSGRGLPR